MAMYRKMVHVEFGTVHSFRPALGVLAHIPHGERELPQRKPVVLTFGIRTAQDGAGNLARGVTN